MRSCAWLLALLAACASVLAAGQTLAVNDDSGNTVALAKPAIRIVTLAPSLTELVFAAAAGDRLVAVSAYSDFPAAAKALPQVADVAGITFEALLALKPDLVIAWKSGNREADINRLRALGIPVFVLEVAKLADVARAIRAIGKLAGSGAQAELAAARIEADFSALRRANAGKARVRVFFEIARLPLMTVNRHHAIDEVISICGGENVFREQAQLVFTPSLEELFRLQPQAIIYTANVPTPPAEQYRGLQAWGKQAIYQVDADNLLRTGPRMVEGARQVCAALDRARQSEARSGKVPG